MSDTKITKTSDRVVVDSGTLRCVFAIDADGTAAATQLASIMGEYDEQAKKLAAVQAKYEALHEAARAVADKAVLKRMFREPADPEHFDYEIVALAKLLENDK